MTASPTSSPHQKPSKLVPLLGGTLVILLFVGGFWLMAGTDGESCQADTDCRVGMFACVDGRCRAACDSTRTLPKTRRVGPPSLSTP